MISFYVKTGKNVFRRDGSVIMFQTVLMDQMSLMIVVCIAFALTFCLFMMFSRFGCTCFPATGQNNLNDCLTGLSWLCLWTVSIFRTLDRVLYLSFCFVLKICCHLTFALLKHHKCTFEVAFTLGYSSPEHCHCRAMFDHFRSWRCSQLFFLSNFWAPIVTRLC